MPPWREQDCPCAGLSHEPRRRLQGTEKPHVQGCGIYAEKRASPFSWTGISLLERKVIRPKMAQNTFSPKGSPHRSPGVPHSHRTSPAGWLQQFLPAASLSSLRSPPSCLPSARARSKLLFSSIPCVWDTINPRCLHVKRSVPQPGVFGAHLCSRFGMEGPESLERRSPANPTSRWMHCWRR